MFHNSAKIPQALAYIPPSDVMSIFNKLKHNLDISNDQKILDFYEYLELK